MSEKKEGAYNNFESLTKRLLGVSKAALNKQVDHYNARKAKRKKRKNSNS